LTGCQLAQLNFEMHNFGGAILSGRPIVFLPTEQKYAFMAASKLSGFYRMGWQTRSCGRMHV